MKVLLFTEHGTVQLINGDEIEWSSDDDEKFRDEFGEDFLDGDDTDDVADYLMDMELLEDEEEFEVREGDLEDYDETEDDYSDSPLDGDEIIEGEFTDAKRR